MIAIADLKLVGDGGKDWACGTDVQLRQGSESQLGLLAGAVTSVVLPRCSLFTKFISLDSLVVTQVPC
jgi:hypothetical protein